MNSRPFAERALFVVVFGVLVWCAAPGLYLRDSGELATAVFGLGVAHETGFSLYLLVGKALALIPLGEVATRVTFFSALAGAVAAWLVFRVVVRASGERTPATVIGGCAGAAALVCGATFWKSSTVVEVYAPSVAALALVLYCVDADDVAQGGIWAGFLGGLSLGLHALVRILAGPPIALWAALAVRRLRWPREAAAAILVFALVVLYLPLRSHAAHVIAPFGAPRSVIAVGRYLMAARTRQAFAGDMLRLATLPRTLARFGVLVEGQLGLPLLLLGVGGMALLVVRRRRLGVLVAVVALADVVYSALVNPMGIDDWQDGVALALAIAIGAGVAVAAIGARLGRRLGPFAALTVAFLALLPTWLADVDAKLGLDSSATRLCGDAIGQAPPRALAFVTTDDLSAGLLYEQTVAGLRPDVTVLVRQLLPESAETARRLKRGAAAAPPARSFQTSEREIERALLPAELPRRRVLWEPGSDAPPVGVLTPDVPLFVLDRGPQTAPSTSWGARLEPLSRSADPFVRHDVAVLLVALGNAALGRSDENAARTLFEAALELHPDDAPAEVDLAVLDARHGNWAAALVRTQAVLDRDPDRAVARLNAARYQLALGQLDGAARDFERATRLSPDEQAPWVGLGKVALAAGDRARALRCLTEAGRRGPLSPEALSLAEALHARHE